MAPPAQHRPPGRDSSRPPWLADLLEAYAVLDAGIARAVAATGGTPACRAGCDACCRQSIPASSLEVMGLRWFALTHLSGQAAHRVAAALGQRDDPACPFLLDGGCAAYALRPMACREFMVFGRPCALGERTEVDRPDDVLVLPAAAQRQAFSLLLPHYGILDPTARAKALADKLVLRDTRLLRQIDWSGLSRALLSK